MEKLNAKELKEIKYMGVNIKFKNGDTLNTYFFGRDESRRIHLMRAADELLLNNDREAHIVLLSSIGAPIGLAKATNVHSVRVNSVSAVPSLSCDDDTIISIMREVNRSSFIYSEDDLIDTESNIKSIVDDFRNGFSRWDASWK